MATVLKVTARASVGDPFVAASPSLVRRGAPGIIHLE
jgi:hypothetical protein